MFNSTRGSVSVLSSTVQPPSGARRTCTSGTALWTCDAGEAQAGLGVERAQLGQHVGNVLGIDPAARLQLVRATARDERQVLQHRPHRRVQPVPVGKLQRQALLQVARTDPARVAGLHQLQPRKDVGGAQTVADRDLDQRNAQVAVLLQLVGKDQRRLDHVGRPAHRPDLPAQVLVERDLGGQRVEIAPVAIAPANATVGHRAPGDRCHRCRRELEERVLLDLRDQVLGELQVRHLQQLDRLLQLRRHRQRLALTQLDPR